MLLWRQDRQEIPDGKSTDPAAAVIIEESPLLLDLAHLHHVVSTATVGLEWGDNPFRIGVEGLLTGIVLDDSGHRTLPYRMYWLTCGITL
jgi:hypothetical protein